MFHLLTTQKNVSCTFLWAHKKKLNHPLFSIQLIQEKPRCLLEAQMSCCVLLMNKMKTDELIRRSAGSGAKIDRLKALPVSSLALPKQIRRDSIIPILCPHLAKIHHIQFFHILCVKVLNLVSSLI